jgi:hypothetical protein
VQIQISHPNRAARSRKNTAHIFIYNVISDRKAKSADPDQTARMRQQIPIYTVHPCNQGTSMELRVK